MVKGIEECRAGLAQNLCLNNYDISKTVGKGFMNLSLLLTQQCNLDCSYCYQSKEFKAVGNLMSKEIADKAIAFAFTSFGESEVYISLFGGEPFLNFEVLKYSVEKYPQVIFVATTNGKILLENPEILSWVASQANHLIISFSISSLKSVYGRGMVYASQPLFDVLKLNKGEVHYVVEDPCESGVYEDIRYILEQNLPQLRVSLPKEQQVLMYRKEYFIGLFKRIADMVYGGSFPSNHFGWDTALKSNICRKIKGEALVTTSSSFCGAGFHYLAVDFKGDIYPCDYFVDLPQFRIGTLEAGFFSPNRFFEFAPDWADRIFSFCEDCSLGDVRLCPNAMCYAENFRANGDFFKPTLKACALREIEFEIYSYVAKLSCEKHLLVGALDESKFVV